MGLIVSNLRIGGQYAVQNQLHHLLLIFSHLTFSMLSMLNSYIQFLNKFNVKLHIDEQQK